MDVCFITDRCYLDFICRSNRCSNALLPSCAHRIESDLPMCNSCRDRVISSGFLVCLAIAASLVLLIRPTELQSRLRLCGRQSWQLASQLTGRHRVALQDDSSSGYLSQVRITVVQVSLVLRGQKETAPLIVLPLRRSTFLSAGTGTTRSSFQSMVLFTCNEIVRAFGSRSKSVKGLLGH